MKTETIKRECIKKRMGVEMDVKRYDNRNDSLKYKDCN